MVNTLTLKKSSIKALFNTSPLDHLFHHFLRQNTVSQRLTVTIPSRLDDSSYPTELLRRLGQPWDTNRFFDATQAKEDLNSSIDFRRIRTKYQRFGIVLYLSASYPPLSSLFLARFLAGSFTYSPSLHPIILEIPLIILAPTQGFGCSSVISTGSRYQNSSPSIRQYILENNHREYELQYPLGSPILAHVPARISVYLWGLLVLWEGWRTTCDIHEPAVYSKSSSAIACMNVRVLSVCGYLPIFTRCDMPTHHLWNYLDPFSHEPAGKKKIRLIFHCQLQEL